MTRTTTTHPATTTYTKLRDGSWGLRGSGLTAGASVTVSKRDGATKAETVGRVLWTGADGVSLATIASARPESRHGHARRDDGMVRCRRCGRRTLSGDDWCMACGATDYED